MAAILELQEHSDERGSLCAVEEQIPFAIKRVYWIYRAKGIRGGHAHKETIQGLISVRGHCLVEVHRAGSTRSFQLDRPNKLLLLEPADWHIMKDFSEDAVLMVLASEPYRKDDYITEVPR
ncbi:MAG: FdtA/QdtA family cupin domain-containing protein [Deltaproteobacteria bacterium]|nr:FdtA/QdtA family cupin domain-containing protein [Deltaproteobacteria bacterium]